MMDFVPFIEILLPYISSPWHEEPLLLFVSCYLLQMIQLNDVSCFPSDIFFWPEVFYNINNELSIQSFQNVKGWPFFQYELLCLDWYNFIVLVILKKDDGQHISSPGLISVPWCDGQHRQLCSYCKHFFALNFPN